MSDIKSHTKKLIVKVVIPRIISDNPKASFTTRDGSFNEEVPINMQIVKWMNGQQEAYFEMEMSSTKIVKMTPVSDKLYYGEEPVKEPEADA